MAAATSAGWPSRPSGTLAVVAAVVPAPPAASFIMSVSMRPGATTLAVMPMGAASRAIALVSPMTAALAAI